MMNIFDVCNPILAVIPEIVYRTLILGFFRMDPRLLLAGMTEGEREIPANDWRV